jgi:hypothetical protein
MACLGGETIADDMLLEREKPSSFLKIMRFVMPKFLSQLG